ncbi:helix-turn-helix domain-containing protein [Chlamydiales bacterium]|nr:helix-turn-helix domain-containing protein [Chlamydiales bacterium]
MKTNQEKRRFVELRALGISYDKISSELNISKPTLLSWNKEFSKEIANLVFLEFEEMLSHHKLVKKARLETFSHILEKAMSELKERSFETLRAKDLLAVILTLEGKIQQELQNVQYYTGNYKQAFDFDDFGNEEILPLAY